MHRPTASSTAARTKRSTPTPARTIALGRTSSGVEEGRLATGDVVEVDTALPNHGVTARLVSDEIPNDHDPIPKSSNRRNSSPRVNTGSRTPTLRAGADQGGP
jgi:hypothetical protein